jgi:hypothetical protein
LPESVEVDVITTAPEATSEVDDLIRRMGDIERDIDVSINVKVNQTGSVNVPGADVPGFQSGGRFIVPPGYREQTNPFIVAVESGEEVIVRTAQEQRQAETVQQQTGAAADPVQQNITIFNQTREAAALTLAMVHERRRQRLDRTMGI